MAALPYAFYAKHLVARALKNHDMAATLVRSIFAQNSEYGARTQFTAVCEQLKRAGLNKAADVLADAREDLLAYTGFPIQPCKQTRSNKLQERFNKQIRHRTDVVRIFPNRDAIIRLVGSVLAEQHDEWKVSRCCMSFTHETTKAINRRLL